MSYDFGIWKRAATTKTAMVLDAWHAITQEHGHPAMGDFDAEAVLAEIAALFPGEATDPDNALIASSGRDGETAWIIIHAPHSAVARYTGVLMEVALSHGLMLWDPQRGAVSVARTV
ncbi:hypothetical protein [Rhodococcus sp. AG1013]|uniref:hypothetical protein n=1 Tax=unclassified Rhodococcus (in: high G+C Gram-positive bacteria) TaxID=192944 RepID=UPI000E0AA7E5|nr:hypothetical protein [Rhodococcus sp. AG1013]RDI14302.1 hypothetical protein DEU38_13343 [Rhodococcus sp. AG1013]